MPSREIKEAAIALRSKVRWGKNSLIFQMGHLAYVDGHLQPICVSQSAPALDVCALLSNSVRRRRTILTVPWLVEFLSMLDCIGPLLLCYRSALGTLLLLYKYVSFAVHLKEYIILSLEYLIFSYLGIENLNLTLFFHCRRMLLGRCGEMCYLNKLLMLSVLGWLFQVKQLL